MRDSGVPWLAEIPAHWDMTRLKFVARVQTGIALGKDYGGQATSELPYLRVANVQDGFIDLSEVKTMAVPEWEAASATLRKGDVLMNEGGDADKLGRGAIWDGSIAPCLHQNHVFALRPTLVSSKWLATWTGSEFAKAYFETRAKQSTNLASISSTNLLELPIAVPPNREQQAIVARLAHETARLDALLTAKQCLLDLLAEKHKAIIATAVTRGLDPKAKLRDSGVPWLGDIPAHWVVKRLKHIVSRIVDCPHSTPEYEADGPALVVRTADLDWGRLLLDTMRRCSMATYAERSERMRLQANDVLYSREGERFGIAALVPDSESPMCLGQRMMAFRSAAGTHPLFLMWALNGSAVYEQVSQDTIGATSPRVNIPTVVNAFLAFPSYDEQHAIVERIAHETAKLDAVRTATERTISLLKERRAALIVAAVTGQLDAGAAA
jgi:type I restriction enzyme, S subunit